MTNSSQSMEIPNFQLTHFPDLIFQNGLGEAIHQ